MFNNVNVFFKIFNIVLKSFKMFNNVSVFFKISNIVEKSF